jgi:hypothetical protein
MTSYLGLPRTFLEPGQERLCAALAACLGKHDRACVLAEAARIRDRIALADIRVAGALLAACSALC